MSIDNDYFIMEFLFICLNCLCLIDKKKSVALFSYRSQETEACSAQLVMAKCSRSYFSLNLFFDKIFDLLTHFTDEITTRSPAYIHPEAKKAIFFLNELFRF